MPGRNRLGTTGLTAALVAVALVAVALAIGGLAAGTAGASVTGTATLTVSGAGKGTLHEGPSALCTIGRSNGVVITELQGSISGFKKLAVWSLLLSSPTDKAGSYTISPSGSPPSGQFGGAPKGATLATLTLNAASGTFTLKGAKGTLDVTFGSGAKAMTVKGSWNCSA